MKVELNNKEVPKQKKLSYEELENYLHQLSEQSRVLMQRLQEANMTNMFKRLDYLFKILELENVELFPEDFVQECIDEIISSIRIPKEVGVEEES
jgi:hypothetical protein